MPFLESQSQELDARVVATQEANAELLQTVLAQRQEIEALVGGLESVVRDLEVSAQMMGQEEVQGLSGEIRDLESEMKT